MYIFKNALENESNILTFCCQYIQDFRIKKKNNNCADYTFIC